MGRDDLMLVNGQGGTEGVGDTAVYYMYAEMPRHQKLGRDGKLVNGEEYERLPAKVWSVKCTKCKHSVIKQGIDLCDVHQPLLRLRGVTISLLAMFTMSEENYAEAWAIQKAMEQNYPNESGPTPLILGVDPG